MNLRCMYCQTLFGISRDAMLIGLQTMQTESLSYYDFHCPKCRRANRVERARLERANPNWQEAIKILAAEASSIEKETATVEEEARPAASKQTKIATGTKPAAKGKTK